MKIGISPLTNTIYIGNTRKNKTNEVWTKKEDITDEAISCVFEWLKSETKKGGTELFEVKFPDRKGKIIFDLREEKVDIDDIRTKKFISEVE